MKQKTKIIEKTVDYLKNAQPKFVSLVDHGANQTPFAIIKSNTGEVKMTKKKKLRLVRKGAKLAGVRKLTFAKKTYKDEDSVIKYLETNNWQDYSIEEKDGHFEVSGDGVTDATFKSVRKVEVEEGIMGYVGEVTKQAAEDSEIELMDENADAAITDEDETEAETPTEDATELKGEVANVCKFDSWGVYLSEDESVAGVMKDGMNDGVPPGFNEIMMSVFTAVSNVFTSDKSLKEKKSTINQIGTEFATITNSIYEVYEKLLGTEKKTEKQAQLEAVVKGFIETHTAKKEVPATVEKAAPAASDEKLDIIIKTLTDLTTQVAVAKQVAEEATKAAVNANTELAALKQKSPTKKSTNVDATLPEAVDPILKQKMEKDRAAEIAFNERIAKDAFGVR
jgi:hypothetical protein